MRAKKDYEQNQLFLRIKMATYQIMNAATIGISCDRASPIYCW
jgi:hypothetical protein